MWPRIDGLRTMEFGRPGPLRQWLNELVLDGVKVATAGLLSEYEDESEELEHVGEQMVVVDDDGLEIARIVITRVATTTFENVPYAFAEAEGEGFTSIEHWREVHIRYWHESGETIENDTAIACIYFELIKNERSHVGT